METQDIKLPHDCHKDKNEIDHIIEDNAKMQAELCDSIVGLERGKNVLFNHDKPVPLPKLFKYYERLAVWVMICKQMNKPIGNADMVQELLDKTWTMITTHPEYLNPPNKCDTCKVSNCFEKLKLAANPDSYNNAHIRSVKK
jgi:hypothetical protein